MHNRTLTICVLTLVAALAVGSRASLAAAAGSAALQAQPAASAGEKSPLAEILQLSNSYFGRFPFMRAEDVYANIIQGGDTSYLLVSVQTPEEYAKNLFMDSSAGVR